MLNLPQGDVAENPMIGVLITNTEVVGNIETPCGRVEADFVANNTFTSARCGVTDYFTLVRIFNSSNPNPLCLYHRPLYYNGKELDEIMRGGKATSVPSLSLSGERIFLAEVEANVFFEEGCEFEIMVNRCNVHTLLWPHKCMEFDFFLKFTYIETPPYFVNSEVIDARIDSLTVYTTFDIASDYNVTLTGITPSCEIQNTLIRQSASWTLVPGQKPSRFVPMGPDCVTSSYLNESIPFVEQAMKAMDIPDFAKPDLYVKFNNLLPGTVYQLFPEGHERNRYWVPTVISPGRFLPEFETEMDTNADLSLLQVSKICVCPNGIKKLFSTDKLLPPPGPQREQIPSGMTALEHASQQTQLLVSVTVADWERTCGPEGLKTADWQFNKLADKDYAYFEFIIEPEVSSPFAEFRWTRDAGVVAPHKDNIAFQKDYASSGARVTSHVNFTVFSVQYIGTVYQGC